MVGQDLIGGLASGLGQFVHDDAASFIAEKLLSYDPEAREIRGVQFRENRSHVVRYMDEWCNALTFVIKLIP